MGVNIPARAAARLLSIRSVNPGPNTVAGLSGDGPA